VKTFTIYEAKTQLSKLVNMALAGEEVVIARRQTPLVSFKPVRASKVMRKTGALPGLVVSMPESFNESLDDWADDLAPRGVVSRSGKPTKRAARK
jgi:antitoxin (DNA-binding transcriptional repressor) of toxin-antitoxin stability system